MTGTMAAQIYRFDPSSDTLAPVGAGAQRPLRWAAWSPDGASCLLAGNRGTAVRYTRDRFEAVDTNTTRNLRGVAFAPDGQRALLAGNRGALLLSERGAVRELDSPTTENLRRAAWHPSGEYALVIGNAGTVLRYDAASDAVTPLPGDRAHTLRALAWRPDGAYALVGAYASPYAGYPRPHALYRCDGRYLQALLTSDDEDDFVAVDWHPDGRRALIAGYAFRGAASINKLLVYDGGGFASQPVESSQALLGAAWRPGGDEALLCGEGGALMRYASDGRVEQLDSGTSDNLVGPFWRPDGGEALLLRGPGERVYTV